MLPLVPIDELPDGANYSRNDGCEESDTCLECPLPKCKFELTNTERGERRKGSRPEQVATLLKNGWTPHEVAHRFGISIRTVFRDQRQVKGYRT